MGTESESVNRCHFLLSGASDLFYIPTVVVTPSGRGPRDIQAAQAVAPSEFPRPLRGARHIFGAWPGFDPWAVFFDDLQFCERLGASRPFILLQMAAITAFRLNGLCYFERQSIFGSDIAPPSASSAQWGNSPHNGSRDPGSIPGGGVLGLGACVRCARSTRLPRNVYQETH